MNILLVDDNQDITQMLEKYFSLLGHSCISTNLGHEAFSLIQKNKFDLILLDLTMPKYSGYDLLESLKINDLMKNNHIVVLTAASLTHHDIKSLDEFGVKLVLKKPIDPDEILSKCMIC